MFLTENWFIQKTFAIFNFIQYMLWQGTYSLFHLMKVQKVSNLVFSWGSLIHIKNRVAKRSKYPSKYCYP